MERTLLLAIAFGTTLMASAQLAPDTDAPLFQHMLEVNKEWRNMHDPTLRTDPIVHFASDAARIAMHLHLVREQLMDRTAEGYSATQANARRYLLDALDAYADRGLFPQNHVLPYRNPVFIDPIGTACAVGQLMIESGHADLAQRIDAEMETAYVHDMHCAAVDAWAVEHGFTEDELAWIQPGYAPDIPWMTLGNGTNGEVSELLRLGNDDLLVAGQFTTAGGITLNHVARWNGTAYEAMGSLPEGMVNCAIDFDGVPYIGGAFNGGTADLLYWNGTTWVPQAVFASKYAEVTALQVHNGALYAAGIRSGFAGFEYAVERLVSSSWESVGQVLNGRIDALETFDGALVCAGAFTDVYPTDGTNIMKVARLNGDTWTQVGDALNGNVYDLLVHDGQLYAGGDLVAEVATYFGLARIAPAASTWEQLLPNVALHFFSPLDGSVHINAMQVHHDKIYLAGDFHTGSGMISGTGLAVFNGTADAVEPYCQFGGPVMDLEIMSPNSLVIGGSSDIYANIATTDLATGIHERSAEQLTLQIAPNPLTAQATVQIPEVLGTNAQVRVTDVAGRTVAMPIHRAGNILRLDATQLATGTYVIELLGNGRSATARAVKE